MAEEQFWINSAKELARLFAYMPEVRPSELGADAQKFLETYKPASKLWDEQAEDLRKSFVYMSPQEFVSTYETYMDEKRKSDSH